MEDQPQANKKLWWVQSIEAKAGTCFCSLYRTNIVYVIWIYLQADVVLLYYQLSWYEGRSTSLHFFILQILSCLSSNNNNNNTHTQLLKLNGKLNIIQHQQWPAEALCGTVQQLCETEQIPSANTQSSKQVSALSTKHGAYSAPVPFRDKSMTVARQVCFHRYARN